MKILTNLSLTCLAIFCLLANTEAQNITQTIRGTVVDQDSKNALIGATILVVSSENSGGTTTDLDGSFKIENIPVGRTTLLISYLGYEERTIQNLLLESGKETILNIELVEAINQLEDVVVKAHKNKGEVLNEMALLSAKTLSVEQVQRYAGAIDDPSRLVSSFAGVTGDAEGTNEIVVRGNSPKGILWRLEGIEIPNPNHFAEEGATGGPINALNSSMLANSDFYTGAFEPEYGNAFSGVFDMKLRNGNNEKHEFSAMLSVMGTDITAEGPFSKNYSGSYLANYRYSTLAILDNLNIVDFGGVPKYQDASFKLRLPAGKKNIFTLFGLGGLSSISQETTDSNNDEIILEKEKVSSNFGVLGLTHSYLISKNAYWKTTLSLSARKTDYDYLEKGKNGTFFQSYLEDFTKRYGRVASTYHHKLDAKNKFKAGVILTRQNYDLTAEDQDTEDGISMPVLGQDGNADLLQGFVSWKHRFNEKLTGVSGLHYMNFLYNHKQSLEPRFALKYKMKNRQNLSLGLGLHSKIESISTYLAEVEGENGYYQPNENLGLMKAAHLVLGYDRFLGKNTRLKTEAYYQHLYNVPIEDSPDSHFSLLNLTEYFVNTELVNEGTGTNYGVEITLEKFLTKGFYYMGTASLYRSLYTASDGMAYSTTFDGNYAANFLAGKEFKIGKGKKDRTYFVNTKISLIGGRRFTPIDLEASIKEGGTVRDETNPFGYKGDDIFKADLAIGYRRNYKKVTSEVKIDIQNISNNAGRVFNYYDSEAEAIAHTTQLGLFPVLSYKIKF